MRQDYKEQVELLLEVLPEMAKQSCFVLHGGTAINFFVREMPRLSVDIDLTYMPLEDRDTSLNNINQGLCVFRANVNTDSLVFFFIKSVLLSCLSSLRRRRQNAGKKNGHKSDKGSSEA